MSDEILDFINNIEETAREVTQKRKNQRYPKFLKIKARMLREVEGLSYKQIAEALDILSWRTIESWGQKAKWVKGSLAQLTEEVEFDKKMELARKMGLGRIDQLAKAKELMEAQKIKTMSVPTKNGVAEVSQEMPDYKIQNEGLKRAMELTGTKVERTETEHKHSGEIVHKYALPEKGNIKELGKDAGSYS